ETLLGTLLALGVMLAAASWWSATARERSLATAITPAPHVSLAPPPAAASPSPSPAAAAAARLSVRFEHPFDKAALRVWVDGSLVLSGTLEGQSRRKMLLFKGNRGEGEEVLEVPPGRHTVKV